MMLTLAWKEYREHRSVWLTMVLMTVLLAFGLMQLGSASDPSITARVALTVLAMAGAYGVVCGSMMLAGEREGGTLVFLDIFLGKRGLLWLLKLLIALLLALTEGLAVALALRLLKIAPPEWMVGFIGQDTSFHNIGVNNAATRFGLDLWFWVLPLVTLEACAWGMLGSAIMRRVLEGAALAVGMAAPILLISIMAPAPVFLGVRLVAAVCVLIASVSTFLTQSRDTPLGPPPKREEVPHPLREMAERWDGAKFDLGRRAPALVYGDEEIVLAEPVDEEPVRRVRRRVQRPVDATSPGQVLWWLAFGQAGVTFTVLALFAAFLGFFMPDHGQVLWPLATLLLGVACGTATFAQEQSDLSYQFLAAQHFPLHTIWNVKMLFWLTVAALVTVIMFMTGGFLLLMKAASRVPADPLPRGFEFGTLLGLMGPVLFFGVWLAYGFSAGQVFVLLCRKPILAILLAGVASAVALGLWLPSLLTGSMSGWQVWVLPVLAFVATRRLVRAWAGGRIKERKPLAALVGFGAVCLAWAALVVGYRAWQLPNVGEPLDRIAFRASIPLGKNNAAGQLFLEALAEFDDPAGKQKQWLAKLEAATRLPLGVMETPSGDGHAPILRHLPTCQKMTERLVILADWPGAGDRAAASAEHIAQILALSRTLRNKAPMVSYLVGTEIESRGLAGVHTWLRRSPGTDVLARLLEELNRHVAETPTAVDCLQTECFRCGGLLDNPTGWAFYSGALDAGRVPERWLGGSIALSLDTPWESERSARLWQAVWAGHFRNLRTPFEKLAEMPEPRQTRKETTRQILRGWVPADEGPDASWTLESLARELDATWLSDDKLFAPVMTLRAAAMRARYRVDACRLAVALTLYEQREGKTAQRLDELVPKYLPEVPIDSYSGQPYRYRISQGEPVVRRGQAEQVPAGYGILWSTGPDRIDHGGRRDGSDFADDHVRWESVELDLITTVPLGTRKAP